MALRADTDDIEAILKDDWDGETALTIFLRIANVFVNNVVTCAARKSITIDSDSLELMEALLAAHFYMMSDRGLSQKSTGSTSGTFMGRTDMGLDATPHGQSAKMLDSSGCAEALAKGNRATAFWNGKIPSEQITYTERS